MNNSLELGRLDFSRPDYNYYHITVDDLKCHRVAEDPWSLQSHPNHDVLNSLSPYLR